MQNKKCYSCDPAWRKLNNIRKHKRIIQLDKCHLLLASSCQTQGIYKWSILNDQYSKFLDYPQYLNVTKDGDFNLVTDKTGKVYFITHDYIHVIQQGIWHSFPPIPFDFTLEPGSLAMVNANGILHLVGGSNNGNHYIWKDEKKEFERKREIANYRNINGVSLIYVKSKDIIFMIGGHDLESDWKLGIRICKANVWRKFDLTYFYSYAATTLTQNEEYIIISGGHTNKECNDCIYVIDIRNDKNYRIEQLHGIRVPKLQTAHNIFSFRGGIKQQLLINGFVRNLFKLSEFQDLLFPPNDILQIVYNWYCVEEIHWIETGETNGNDHFTVELSHIIELYEKEVEYIDSGAHLVYGDERNDCAYYYGDELWEIYH